ncbi:thiamine-phosphate kinase [Sphingomonas ginkgonis]|uniref:Thiamine-monophosphate kinase n=1 Tax=Sphingomonas ginkgonis TaxID=2315330 RepID=A0A3R9YKY9_9SPHN|nr:thiamine-phosphate kinase [Sphingomonas ginkgonis]RST29872.1 thiamine-phosphate kinase [Sphingomonas ginkgonis]
MSGEQQILAALRPLATDPAARGLLDDAALLDGLVLSHDTIAEGVHYLPDDPPDSVGWKLAAVNLSDLAAKGAAPAGALLSLTLRGDSEWEERFLRGFHAACESYGLPLLGGDTIALPDGAPRVLGLTVLGRAGARTPSRGGGRPGDRLWVAGVLGDSAAGLDCLRRDTKAEGPLVDVYRRPIPQLAAGRALAGVANAMMDVSDGLLLDAARLADASGCGADIALDTLPLSTSFVAERGAGLDARLFAATGGDDYALLCALPAGVDPNATLCLPEGTRMAAVGSLTDGMGIHLTDDGEPVPLPERLGHEHFA